MSFCPSCYQKVNYDDVCCGYCGTELKAFGHRSIPLYRARGRSYLCDSCSYHADDSCTYPQRPMAKDCIMYDDVNKLIPESYSIRTRDLIRLWMGRNKGFLLMGLIIFLVVMVTWLKYR